MGIVINSEVILETERLRLRPLKPKDAETVFAWAGDDRVTEYMNYVTYKSAEQVKEWLRELKPEEESYTFGFERKSDHMLIGSGSVRRINEERDWGFGYNVRYDCWNQGYASEAVKAMMEFAVRNFNIKCFMAEHAIDNPASGKVMEKCGLSFSHYSEYAKVDGSRTFRSKFYKRYEGEQV